MINALSQLFNKLLVGHDAELSRKILALAIPMTIGAAVQTSYHLVNAFWVGRLSTDAVAVISLTLPVNMFLTSLGSGLSLAASILVAQCFGRQDRSQINHVVAQALLALVALSLALSVLGYWLAPELTRVFNVSDKIYADLLAYLRVSFISMVFLMLTTLYQSVLRGLGEARAPLRIIMVSVVINAVLDPLLIFGFGPLPAYGVIGAAYATLITQIITACAGIHLMLRPRFGVSLSFAQFLPNGTTIWRLFSIGIPASVEQSMQALSVTAMNLLVAPFGLLALAAYGIAFRILTLTMIPIFCLSMATSILVGQSLGAGQRNVMPIAKQAIGLGFVLLATISLLFLAFADHVVAIFVPVDPGLIELASRVLRILSLSLVLVVVQSVCCGAMRGAEATLASMGLSLIAMWLIQLPLTYLMSRSFMLGEDGLWWASLVGGSLSVLLTVWYFRCQRWLPE